MGVPDVKVPALSPLPVNSIVVEDVTAVTVNTWFNAVSLCPETVTVSPTTSDRTVASWVQVVIVELQLATTF